MDSLRVVVFPRDLKQEGQMMTRHIRWGLAALMGVVVACGPQAGANAPKAEEEAAADSDESAETDEEAVADTSNAEAEETADEDASAEEGPEEEGANPNVKQPDKDKVAELEKKCSPKNQEACFDLAVELDNGLLDVPKLQRVMKLAEDACTAGVSRACRSLGERYRDGLQVNRNVNEALKYFKEACKLGDQPACAEDGRKKK